MTPYLELQIDGTAIDLPPDGFSVQLTYRSSQGFNPSGSYSERSIQPPASKTNGTVFGRWWDALVNDLSGTEFKPMYLSVDGVPILIGRAQLLGCEYEGGVYDPQAVRADVALYGASGDWITQLGDTPLSALDWSDTLHEWTDGIVTSKFAALYPTSDYNYFPAKQRDWGASVGGGYYAIQTIDTALGLFVPAVLSRIFAYLGYTFDSPFFDTVAGKAISLGVFFPKYYPDEFSVQWINGFWERNAARTYTNGGIGIIEGLDFNTHTPAPQADQFTNSIAFAPYGLAGEFEAPISGWYKFSYRVTVANFVGFTTTNLAIRVFTDLNRVIGGNILGGAPVVVDGDTVTESIVGYLSKGEKAYPILFAAGGDFAGGDTFDVTYCKMEVLGDRPEITYGSPIDLRYLLQDWTCRDFWRGIIHALHLEFETDVANRTVFFDPFDSYLYNDPPTFAVPAGGASQINDGFLTAAVDKTDKIDLSKTKDSFDSIENTTVFKYKEDSGDQTVKSFEENSEYTLHEARYGRNTNRFKQGIIDFENPFFSPTLMLKDESLRHPDSLKIPIVPMVYPKDWTEEQTATEKAESYAPRLLYFAGQRANLNYAIWFRDNTGTDAKITLPECFSVNYNDELNKDFSLAFGNEQTDGGEAVGLLQRFYLSEMARVRSGRNREAFWYLNASDIQNLSFRPKVLQSGSQWILKEINSYNPLTAESTKVVLQRDHPQEAEDLANIVNSTISGYAALTKETSI